MDFHSSGGKSVSEDLNYTSGLNLSSVSQNTSFGDGLASELSDTLNESLHIEDAQESSEVDDYGDVDEIKSDQKCLMKYEMFPCSDKIPPSDDAYSEEEEEDEEPLEQINNHSLDMNPIVTRSICLPSPSDLVSALKGSREKLGIPSKNLTVTWADDVYDPPPTTLSHTVKSKKSQKQWSSKAEKGNKKKGKSKEKAGKVTRGSSSKDKKQFRRLSGNSDKCYKSLDARERLVDPDDGSDFDAGSPDSYCGSSFLRESVTKVHMSVTEAL